MIIRILVPFVLAALAASGVHGQGSCCGDKATGASAALLAAPDKKGVQKVTVVVDNGFKPSTINAKAGHPIEITFDTTSKGCITSVVFDSLKLKKPLTDGQKTVVTFTPKKAGTIGFQCPMAMFKGKVIVK